MQDGEEHQGTGGGAAPLTRTRNEGYDDDDDDGREENGKTTKFAALCSAFGKKTPQEAATAVKTDPRAQSGQHGGRGSSSDRNSRPVSFERPPDAPLEHPRDFVERQGGQPDVRGSTTVAMAVAAAAVREAPGRTTATGRTTAAGSVAALKPWTLINKIGPKTSGTSTGGPRSGDAGRRATSTTTASDRGIHGDPSDPDGGGGGGGGSIRRRWHLVNAKTNAVRACRRARTAAAASAGQQAVRQRWGGLKSARQTTSIFMRGLAAVSDDVDDDEFARSSSDNAGSGEERGGRSDESSSIWCESDGGNEECSSWYDSGLSREVSGCGGGGGLVRQACME